MEIAVLGAGAMGCLYGAGLFERGHDVTLVDVRAEQVRTINESGLTITADGREKRLRIRARFPTDVGAAPELILLFTKAFHTEAALAGARSWMGAGTWVLSLQNGLGHVEIIERFVDRARIAVGMTTFPADAPGPGRVHTQGGGATRIFSADGTMTLPLQRIADALDGAGFHCRVSPTVWASIWEKVAFNAALNGLTAVTRLTVGRLGEAPDGRALAERVVNEVLEVARRKGIAVDPPAVHATLAGAFRDHRDHQPSMLQDVLAQRRTEVEFIHGAILQEAHRLGLEAPATEALYRLIRTLEQNYPGRGS